MAFREKKSTIHSSRKNTFHEMMDLERKNKLKQMQASPEIYPASTRSTIAVNGRDSSSTSQRPALAPNGGRAINTPTLALSIPTPSPSNRARYAIKDGDLVPAEEVEREAESDAASSICHSPGWDDLSGKKEKEKKQKAKALKKEKEKAEAKARTEAKHAAKLKNRLSKAPPTNNKLSKRVIPMNRSTSAPVVQTLPKLIEKHDEVNDHAEENTRRGSIETGLKTFIQATHAIPVPWRSSHGAPTQASLMTPVSTTGGTGLRRTSTGNGFIGGLKLRMAEQAQGPDRRREQAIPDETTPLPHTSESQPRHTLETPPLHLIQLQNQAEKVQHTQRDSKVEPPVSEGEEQFRTPQQWDSIYEQAARMLRGPERPEKPGQEGHATYWKGRRREKSYPPTSSYFPLEAGSPRTDSFIANHSRTSSRQRTSEDKGSQGRRGSSGFSSDDRSNNTRNTSVERPGTGGSSRTHDSGYVRQQRKESKDRSVPGMQDEQQVFGVLSESVKSESSRGRRLSWTSFISRSRQSSVEASSTIRPAMASTYDKQGVRPDSAPADSTPSQPRPVAEPPASHIDSSLLKRQNSIKSNTSGFKGFRNAARSVFSRDLSIVRPPTESLPNPGEVVPLETGQLRLTKKASFIALDSNGRPLSKAERFFGHSLPIAPTKDSENGCPTSSRYPNSPDVVENAAASSRNSHSRSATDSSEELSLDETSNITTPTASRPHSQKGYDQPAQSHPNKARTQDQSTHISPQIKEPRIPDRSPARELFVCGSISTIELTRQPSLSRSTSNPELQEEKADLSFLPALKHQALTKPLPTPKPDLKGKGKASSHISKQTLLKSSPLAAPPTPTAMISTSPTFPPSPGSSQYLQNARASLPKAPSRHSTASPTPSGPEPIAKMFVICCSCKYFHDMPSKIYECMARAESVVEDRDMGVRGLVSTSVRCPWCGHGMSTRCCAGWAAVVVLRERLH